LCLIRLLDAGANPNALDVHMKTPIDYGEFRGSVMLAKDIYFL